LNTNNFPSQTTGATTAIPGIDQENGRPAGGAAEAGSWSQFRLDRQSPSYWRVNFHHPPINTLTAQTMIELKEIVDLIEGNPELNVVVFRSENPDFFIAHYDLEHDPKKTSSLPLGPTGLPLWLDVTTRLSRAEAVSIACIRGRARGAGSEFVLACDLRFASRENCLLGQFEVGSGLIPGGGPMARLSRLVGRGRALEILLVGEDFDGPRAEKYGYVNRAISDDRLDEEVEAMALRLASFDHQAIARIKSYVNQVTLPGNDELLPPLGDFRKAMARSETGARLARLEELGLNTESDFERRLGTRIVEAGQGPSKER